MNNRSYLFACLSYSSQSWYRDAPLYPPSVCQISRQSDMAFAFYSSFCKCAKRGKKIRRKKNAQSYRNVSIPSVYRRHEMQKKREYGDRVREVEFASFTPLVFATTGGMGKEAITFYRRLAELLSKRSALSYSSTLAWICCTLSFSLLRSATMCIRGSRSISFRSPDASPEMGLTNGHRDF